MAPGHLSAGPGTWDCWITRTVTRPWKAQKEALSLVNCLPQSCARRILEKTSPSCLFRCYLLAQAERDQRMLWAGRWRKSCLPCSVATPLCTNHGPHTGSGVTPRPALAALHSPGGSKRQFYKSQRKNKAVTQAVQGCAAGWDPAAAPASRWETSLVMVFAYASLRGAVLPPAGECKRNVSLDTGRPPRAQFSARLQEHAELPARI